MSRQSTRAVGAGEASRPLPSLSLSLSHNLSQNLSRSHTQSHSQQ
eukprot:COSAG06_NODE_47120_length_341_cov_1.194215_1_plen_44_part_01